MPLAALPLHTSACRSAKLPPLVRRDDPRTIRPDEARARTVLQIRPRPHHVRRWNPFRNADNQGYARIGGLHDRVGRKWRRHENYARVRARSARPLRDRVEHGPVQMFLPAFARRNASHHVRSVRDGLLGVKRSLFPGESLHQQTRVLVHQNAHAAAPCRASRTTFSAASRMPSATVKFKPDSVKICRPCSTFVPSIRTTTGAFTDSSRAAFTTPTASVSQRRMPPKILTSTACTEGSERRIRNALRICSSLAPPPTSRKLAGLPPAYLMMSMVAIAKPAPFTMQATLPSSLM